MAFCPRCGAKLETDAHKCPGCGLTLAIPDASELAGQKTAASPAATGDMPGDEEALPIGFTLKARYEILRVLAKGGMGWVYKARDKKDDRMVAVKVIRRDLADNPTWRRRLGEEVVLAGRLSHGNVVRTAGLEEADGFTFLPMPYIDGNDLKTVISERGALGVGEALRIARQVAEALKSAHDVGVIHRDLKPQNIMIDSQGTAYIADFGIAMSAGMGEGADGEITGTPEYMSPEQAEGKNVDLRTDIFSFGLVLYEMLTGTIPFRGDTVAATLDRRRQQTAEPPSRLNPAVPGWLDRLTLRALERSRGDRYASIDEVISELEAHVS